MQFKSELVQFKSELVNDVVAALRPTPAPLCGSSTLDSTHEAGLFPLQLSAVVTASGGGVNPALGSTHEGSGLASSSGTAGVAGSGETPVLASADGLPIVPGSASSVRAAEVLGQGDAFARHDGVHELSLAASPALVSCSANDASSTAEESPGVGASDTEDRVHDSVVADPHGRYTGDDFDGWETEYPGKEDFCRGYIDKFHISYRGSLHVHCIEVGNGRHILVTVHRRRFVTENENERDVDDA